jgi:hypothetical protein
MQFRLLYLVTIPFVLTSAASAAQTGKSCRLAGAIFGIDPFAEMLLVKDPGGYIRNIKLSSKTSFARLPVGEGKVSRMAPAELNIGDLVCVHNDGGEIAGEISVVSRSDLHRAQRSFLAQWQRNSLYGTVTSVDAAGRAMVVKPLSPSLDRDEVRVLLPASARLRSSLPASRRITDSQPFELAQLQPGEPVYIRGARGARESELTASLVLKGGYRAILGALVEVQVANSVVKIQEFGTGRPLRLKITPGESYRTTEDLTIPMRVQTESGVTLAPVGFADLQSGDAILVIGKTTDGSEDGEGLIAVTKFGTFGVAPQDPENRTGWLLAK